MSADFEERDAAYATARTRAEGARCGIGAAFLGNLPAAEDGWRASVAISDGTDVVEVLVAVAAQPPLGSGSVRPEVVVGLVEEMACDYDRDGRLSAMQAATSSGPGLRLDKRFPAVWRGAFD